MICVHATLWLLVQQPHVNPMCTGLGEMRHALGTLCPGRAAFRSPPLPPVTPTCNLLLCGRGVTERALRGSAAPCSQLLNGLDVVVLQCEIQRREPWAVGAGKHLCVPAGKWGGWTRLAARLLAAPWRWPLDTPEPGSSPLTSAPAAASAWQASHCPLKAATWSGVRPSGLLWSTSPPPCTRTFMAATSPRRAARWKPSLQASRWPACSMISR